MISEWQLQAFKSARQEARIRLPGITVLVGANSSGKSAVLQSLLLVAQSVGDRVPGRQVVVNGRWAKLGDFDEIHTTRCQMPISLEMKLDVAALLRIASANRLITGASHLAFHAKGVKSMNYSVKIEKGKEEGVKGLLLPRISECKFRIEGEDAKASELHIVASSVPTDERLERLLATASTQDYRNMSAGLEYEIRKAVNVVDSDSRLAVEHQLVGAVMGGWLPAAYVYRYDQLKEDARRAVAALFGPPGGSEELAQVQSRIGVDIIREVLGQIRGRLTGRPDLEPISRMLGDDGVNNITTLKKLAPLLSLMVPDADERRKIQARLESSIVSGSVSQVALGRVAARASARAILDAQFGKLFRYLGPLREEPRSLYPVAIGADSEDVGVRGEYTASVLDLHKNSIVSFVPPDAFVRDGSSARAANTTLSVAVQDWLSYLGVVERIETSDLAGGMGHRVSVAPTGGALEFRSLVHVGVGVSQVLPVLVMCLLAPPASFLVLEQPELHLHPAVQSRLADFFVAQMLADKKFLVETHSEYLVSRLRLRCAEAPRDGLSSRTVIYCAEPDEAGDGSRYREVPVNRFGALDDWPRGFFDILPHESSAIMEAALRKRLAEKEAGK
jgi:predicted ATPase